MPWSAPSAWSSPLASSRNLLAISLLLTDHIDGQSLGTGRGIGDADVLHSLVAGAARVTLGDAAHITVAVRLTDR